MIYLFHGKERFLSLTEAKNLYKSLIEEKPELEQIELDAENVEPEKILNSIQTHEMFGTGRILFIKRVYSRKDRILITETLLETFKSDSFDVEVVIWEAQKVPVNTKYLKYLKENHSVYESPELNRRTFQTWAKKECEKRDLKIDNDSLREICLRSNYDTERFFNNLEKISIYGGNQIDLDLLNRTTTDTHENDIWELMDSINKKDEKNVIRIINNLLSRKEDPQRILAMIFRNMRILTSIKYLNENGSDRREIASILKLPPFTLPGMIESSSKMSREQILFQYEKLTNLDYQIKTGGIDPQLGLTLLSSKISK